LERCPNCKAELLFDGSEFCDHCGASLKVQAEASSSASGERDIDFVVTEASEDQRDLVGGTSGRRKSDDLPVQSSSQLMEELASDEADRVSGSEPPAISDTHIHDREFSSMETTGAAIPSPSPDMTSSGAPDRTTDDKRGIRKLSDQELKSIEKNLYGSATYLSETEKRDLMKHVTSTQQAFTTEPIVPPKRTATAPSSPADMSGDLPKPGMAKRGRGVAFFFKNIIQIQGDLELRDQDEITVNDRTFVLRKKRMNSKVMIGLSAGVFAVLLLIIGSLFVSSAGNGSGEVVGLVLDAQHRPYVQGATVRFPDLGKSFTSNSQGFFRAANLPVGSHKIEYQVAGGQVVLDYATVTEGGVTTIALSPNSGNTTEVAQAPQKTQQTVPAATMRPAATTVAAQPKHEQPSVATTSEAAPEKPTAKLTLAANVEGARLTLDHTIIGAGNLTYSRLKPGSHEYTVSKEGWQSTSGTVDLAPGEISVLEVALLPVQAQSQPAKSQSEGPFSEGTKLAGSGDFAGAIAKFTEVVNKEPGNAAAYLERADAYSSSGDKKSAYADYLRSAEIMRVAKNYSPAIGAYNKAITADSKAVEAYLGRADLYLAQNEEIAATADYETVIRIDKRNAAAYLGLGQARYSQGNFKEAIKQFKDARDYDPKNPEVYEYLMLSYLASDDLKNMKKTYEKFKANVSETEVSRAASDSKLSAVMRIVQGD
jgi:Tfp pilus assembly protein PilF